MLVSVMKDSLSLKRPRSLSRRLACALALASVVLVGASCTNGEDVIDQNLPGVMPEPDSVLDRAEELGFGQFVALAKASSHRALLEGNTQVTVFAPTNAAFALLPAGEVQAFFVPGNEAALDAFVGYHITTGVLDQTALAGLDQISMLGTDDAFVDTFGSAVIINDATIANTYSGGDNGLLHGVDRPLELPRTVLETLERRGYRTLVELIQLSGLEGSIQGGQLSLFCPSDAAFAALPAGELNDLRDPALVGELRARLQLHLLGGARTASGLYSDEYAQNLDGSFLFFGRDGDGVPTINGLTLDYANLPCVDGVIHGLELVFAELPTVGEQINAQGLMTLGSLAFAGGLTGELNTLFPLTAFGPTDLALELGLQPGVIDMLVDPANVLRLRMFVRAHMVQAPFSYRRLVPGTMLTAVSGDIIDVTESTGETTLNGTAGLTVRDVFASNGVLHVIDGVLDDGQ